MKHWLLAILLASASLSTQAAFDQQHSIWNTLLQKHVVWIRDGHASEVDYRGMQADQAQLQAYLAAVSQVSTAEYGSWNKLQQEAFLINAYNAETVSLILSAYPKLSSIKDLGSWFRSPWKKAFFNLLGEQHSLDDIEQDMLRKPGVFDEPRIHVALVCASIGCPALRNEAYVASRLDAQLNDSLTRFLGDRERNRYSPEHGRLEVSSIFKWYGEDWRRGGFLGVKALFADHADLLADDPAVRKRIRAQQVDLSFLDYDWRLNDVPH